MTSTTQHQNRPLESSAPRPAVIPAVELVGVGKSFVTKRSKGLRRAPLRSKVALAELSLTVESGGVIGVIGVNGSGKSTLIRILSTLLTPDTGHARVFGHDVVTEIEHVRRLINRVSVEASFFKELSPWENLSFSARLYAVAEDLRARVEQLCSELNLAKDVLDRPLKQLSRGQQQKVAIIRSLLSKPSLLLMDEPTTGLDPHSKRDVQRIVRSLHATGEVTVVLCTHDLAEAEALCDRILILHNGALLTDTTPQELRERYGGVSLEDAFLLLTGTDINEDTEDWEEGS